MGSAEFVYRVMPFIVAMFVVNYGLLWLMSTYDGDIWKLQTKINAFVIGAGALSLPILLVQVFSYIGPNNELKAISEIVDELDERRLEQLFVWLAWESKPGVYHDLSIVESIGDDKYLTKGRIIDLIIRFEEFRRKHTSGHWIYSFIRSQMTLLSKALHLMRQQYIPMTRVWKIELILHHFAIYHARLLSNTTTSFDTLKQIIEDMDHPLYIWAYTAFFPNCVHDNRNEIGILCRRIRGIIRKASKSQSNKE
jgi:hypothetical protein